MMTLTLGQFCSELHAMAHRVCPWWLGYLLASPVRRWLQDPGVIVGSFVSDGMTVLDAGPGMGFFAVELFLRHEMHAEHPVGLGPHLAYRRIRHRQS